MLSTASSRRGFVRAALVPLALASAFLVAPACTKQEPAGKTPSSGAPAAVGTKLSVAAASSLRELLEGTKAEFEKAHPGASLSFSFEASSTLSRQIESGSPFDAFLSADAANVDRVATHVDEKTKTSFLSNQLVVVAREGFASPPKDVEGLKAFEGKMALAGPAVPAGKYARSYLEKKGLLASLEPRIASAENVRATLALVESDAADLAIVYVTDARQAKRAKTAYAVPKEDDPGILYVAAALKRSAMPLAAEYVKFLSSPGFRTTAKDLGFIVPGE